MVRIRLIGERGGWQVLVVPVSGFPVPAEEAADVLATLRTLSAAIAAQARLSREVLIQMTHLHFPTGSSTLFARHAREWMPAMGLGVWPDREPPTIWTAKDFEDLVPGQAPRTLIDQVFRITKSEDAKLSARDTMFGYGAVVEVLTRDETEKFLERCRNILLPPITDPTYTCYPFYAPLLEAKSFTTVAAAEIGRITCGCSAYVRESVQDKAVLIAASMPVVSILEGLGAKQQPGTDEWTLERPQTA
jgi:hypothetical protein